MTIDEAILSANSDHQIYFLLTAYLETLQFAGKLPERLTRLPIAGSSDDRSRFRQLIAELEKASIRIDENVRPALKDALSIFGAVLIRLRALDEQKNHAAGERVPERDTSYVRRMMPDRLGAQFC